MKEIERIEESILVDETGKQLTQADIKPIAKAAPQTGGVSDLIAMAINADLDIEKLERLMEMKEREESKTAQAHYIIAFSNFQADCPNIPKTGVVRNSAGNELYSYPKIDVIMNIIRPHLKANGLSVSFDSETSDTQVVAKCFVSHIGGHIAESRFKLPIEQTGNKISTSTTRTNSANSLAKRICLMNALNLVGSDEDDDGTSLTATITPEQAAALRDEVTAIGGDEGFFCNWLCKVRNFEDIPERMMEKAQKAINEQKAERS